MKSGVELIEQERARQIEEEGWDAQHDDEGNDDEQLARAAACYALPESDRGPPNQIGGILSVVWPWDWKWWKSKYDHRIRDLAKAGALCAAEIDRLHRKGVR